MNLMVVYSDIIASSDSMQFYWGGDHLTISCLIILSINFTQIHKKNKNEEKL
jgi:hypothetical protein